MGVTILGIRHHSPACAGLVRRTIARLRPGAVLVEGPADFNDRIGELRLGHTLPIAIFSYRSDGVRSESSWTPLCAHSPEWAAIEESAAVGAALRFIDLPAWHPAFFGVRNRYADRHHRLERLAAALCARFGVSDIDSLWDHLFEQPLDDEALARRLQAYFEELRGDDAADERDGPREAFMIACMRAALATTKQVVVVCGGWHAPALARAIEGGRGRTHAWRLPSLGRAIASRDPVAWPEVPRAPDGSRAGSYLVPYSFHRLDSFSGYESGMPSPAFQDATLRLGFDHAAAAMLAHAVARLRSKHQKVSAADLIAVNATAEGLRRLRGHAVVSRVDLLDGIAACLVKDALDSPLPWTYRGPLRPRTDPILAEVMAAFSGDRTGAIAATTPQPPLLADVAAQLRAHDLEPADPGRLVALDLGGEADRARSRVLHRLRVLGVPGFKRLAGPVGAADAMARERWHLEHRLEAQGTLIEAAVFGATLETAAIGRIEELLVLASGRIGVIAWLLVDAAFIGIDALAGRVLDEVAASVDREPSLAEIGEALEALLGLWRFATLPGVVRSPALGTVIAAALGRGLWLVEGLQGPRAPFDQAQVQAVRTMRDAIVHADAALALDRARACAVMQRRQHDPQAPPAVRGAAVGFLWSVGFFASAEAGTVESTRALRRLARPATLGDFLAGLFVLAREQMRDASGLLGALDAVLGGMSDDDFLVALPSLRLAFTFFPPAEREQIAYAIAALHGRARTTPTSTAAPDILARAAALEADVAAVAQRYGLDEAIT